MDEVAQAAEPTFGVGFSRMTIADPMGGRMRRRVRRGQRSMQGRRKDFRTPGFVRP